MKRILITSFILLVVAGLVLAACNPWAGVSDADKAVQYSERSRNAVQYLCAPVEGNTQAPALNSLSMQIQGLRASWDVYQTQYGFYELPELATVSTDEALKQAVGVECGIAEAARAKAEQLSARGQRARTEDRVFVYDMADFAVVNADAIGTDAQAEFDAAKAAVDVLVTAENEFTAFYAQYGTTTDPALKAKLGNAFEFSKLARTALKAGSWDEAAKQAGFLSKTVAEMRSYVANPTATPTTPASVTRQPFPNGSVTPPAASPTAVPGGQTAPEPTFTPIGGGG